MGTKPKRTSRKKVAVVAQSDAAAAEEILPSFFSSPESDTIASAMYDTTTETLRVQFKAGASVYEYEHIPVLLWKDFIEASSKGKFFAARVRPFFLGRKIQ